jgi:hypothetical protein
VSVISVNILLLRLTKACYIGSDVWSGGGK